MRVRQRLVMVALALFGVSGSAPARAQSAGAMVPLKAGSYMPLYGAPGILVKIAPFRLDTYPVTHQEFVNFVVEHPKWRRSKIIRLYADENYLRDWKSDLSFGDNHPRSAVTNVSWFAAKAYCKAQGKRLPSTDEWEYAAMADAHRRDGRARPEFNKLILGWYERPGTRKNEIGSTFKNYWGVWDMHGLVWEWTHDFNSILISGESRKDVDTDSNTFCGSASVNASDLMNYAAFMRYAFRGSLKANYAVSTLGFRCAK